MKTMASVEEKYSQIIRELDFQVVEEHLLDRFKVLSKRTAYL